MFFEALVFILPLAATIRAEENGAYFKIDEKSFLFLESTISNEKADSLLSCSQLCARRAACKSANFISSQRACSLLGEEQTDQPKNLLKRDGSFYLEKVWWQSVVQTEGLCYFCRQAFVIAKTIISIIQCAFSPISHRFDGFNLKPSATLKVVLNASFVKFVTIFLFRYRINFFSFCHNIQIVSEKIFEWIL